MDFSTTSPEFITALGTHAELIAALVAVVLVAVIALTFGLLYFVKRAMANKLNTRLQVNQDPLSQLNALFAPDATASGSTVVTVEAGQQKVPVDQSADAIVSQFFGEGGSAMLQRALQAAAHNTSGKPTVFINGKQVDADSVDIGDLIAGAHVDGAANHAPSDRLRTLQGLHDAGLIPTPEYETKRAEILKSL